MSGTEHPIVAAAGRDRVVLRMRLGPQPSTPPYLYLPGRLVATLPDGTCEVRLDTPFLGEHHLVPRSDLSPEGSAPGHE